MKKLLGLIAITPLLTLLILATIISEVNADELGHALMLSFSMVVILELFTWGLYQLISTP